MGLRHSLRSILIMSVEFEGFIARRKNLDIRTDTRTALTSIQPSEKIKRTYNFGRTVWVSYPLRGPMQCRLTGRVDGTTVSEQRAKSNDLPLFKRVQNFNTFYDHRSL